MEYLAEQAGVDYSTADLDTVADTADRVFRSLGLFVAQSNSPSASDVVREIGRERRAALLKAVGAEFPDLPRSEQTMFAATLDILWNTASHGLLVDAWGMSIEEATRVIDWAVEAVRTGNRPSVGAPSNSPLRRRTPSV
jgi:hypothetical protein